MAVALVALFVAMGGTAVATSRILIKSTKQLSPSVLNALKGHAGPIGPPGAAGPQGKEGKEGPQGKEGPAGQNLTAQTILPSGQSESGGFSAGGGDANTEYEEGIFPFVTKTYGYIGAGITYVQPLATAIEKSHIISVTGTSAAHCPGAGKAERGYLCLYVFGSNDVNPGYGYSETSTGYSIPSPGASLFWKIAEKGVPYAYGEYTVTAP